MELKTIGRDEPAFSTAARMHSEWAQALRRRDTAWLEAHLAPDLEYIAWDGARKTRTDMIAQVGFSVVAEATSTIESVREHRGLFIVGGVNSVRTVSADAASTMSEPMREASHAGAVVRYTSLWSFDEPEPLLLHHHTTRVAAPTGGGV